jgi:ABC-type transporter Mla subunit MlaD
LSHGKHNSDPVLTQLVRIEEFLLHLHKDIKAIMGKLEDATAALNTMTASLNDIGTEVDKIGTETDGLLKAIADLTAAAGSLQTTPEFDAALAAAQAATDAVKARVVTVDQKVADATP